MIVQEVEITNNSDNVVTFDFNKFLNGENNKDCEVNCTLVNDFKHKLFDATICKIRIQASGFLDSLNFIRTKAKGLPIKYAHESFRSIFEDQQQQSELELHSSGNISDTKVEINAKKTIYLFFYTQ